MLLLALSLPAFATVPRQATAAVAIPRGTLSAPWWAVIADDDDSSLLLRSEDDGATFNAVWGDPLADNITDAAYTDDGYAVLMGENRIWYNNGGDLWTEQPLLFTATSTTSVVAGGDKLYFASPRSGVYAGRPGSAPTLEMSSAGVGSVFEGWAGPVAIATNGTLYWKHGGSWTSATMPSGYTPYWGTSDSSNLYMGATDGTVHKYNGSTWTTCGDVPYASESAASPGITRISADASTILVARAGMGPAVSTDGCATWSDTSPPFDYSASDAYSFALDATAVTGVGIVNGRIWSSGYDGLGYTDDSGATWEKPQLLGADETRSVAFSPRFNSDGDVLLGAAGGGVVRTGNGGVSFSAPGLGAYGSGTASVLLPPSASSIQTAYALIDGAVFKSTDRGSHWNASVTPFTSAESLDLGASSRLWANNITVDPEVHGMMAYSSDGGTTWRNVYALPISFDVYPTRHVLDLPGLICAMHDADVACSTDNLGTWVDVFTPSVGTMHAMAAVPKDAPTRLIVSDSSGLWVADIGTWEFTQVYTAGTTDVRRLAVADDGTVLAGDQAGHLLQSTDSGLTWSDTGATLPSQFHALEPRPGFARWGQVLAGGLAGTWMLGTDGSSTRFMNWQRVDDDTNYVTCEGCTVIADDEAALSGASTLASGDTYQVRVRGKRLRVLGKATSRSTVNVTVDGTSVYAGTVSRSTYGQLLSVHGLSDDWHVVQLTTTGSVDIDATESSGADLPADGFGISTALPGADGEPADTTPMVSLASDVPGLQIEAADEPTGGCSTAPGNAGALLAFAGLAVAASRRSSRPA